MEWYEWFLFANVLILDILLLLILILLIVCILDEEGERNKWE